MTSVLGRSYDWPRFWVLPGAAHLDGDAGFFPDPAGPGLLVPQVPAVTLADCRAQRCLVLLAEPGLGKTRAIDDEVAGRAAAGGVSPEVRCVDLGAFDDARMLHAALFEHETWRRWRDGDHTLELWLDSLDEALLHVRSVEKLLLYELRELGAGHRSRLRLRVACRSTEWRESFADGLAELWSDEENPTLRLQLAPLRRADVLTAASAVELDANAFVGEIDERGLTELAAQPLTLAMLLEAAVEGALPRTRAELFEQGCRLLCYDPDPRRGAGGVLHAGQRLAVAQRVAATTLLAGRAAVTAEPPPHAGRVVPVSEIAGGHERDPEANAAADFRVDVPQIEDTLRASLFAAAQGSVRFAHRALAEFLAARWLVDRRFERQQILSLLVAPNDEEERLVPQLREVAAWTVALDPDLLGDVLRHEPDVLLRVERLDLGAEDRHRIVAALLAAEDVAERVALFDRRTRRVLRTLSHPEIAGQLRQVLSDGRAPLAVRQLAVTIARAGTVTELQRDLLLIALDERQPDHFRAHAIGALDDLADNDDVRRALLPLALDDQPTDRTDEIKGQALEAVCPSVVSAVEVLPSLSPPKDRHLIGSYRMFLRRVVPEALAPEDLPAALKWAAAMRADGPLAPALAGLVDAVLARAWQHLDRPGMPEALWSVLVPRLRADGDLLRGDDRAAHEEVFRDATKRRRLLPLLAGAVRDDALQPFWAVHSVPALLSLEDVPWLLERVTGTAHRPTRAAYAALLAAAFVPEIADLDVVLTAADEDADLRAAMSPWLDAVNLDSEQARFHRRRADTRAPAPPDAPDMAKEIETHLARAQDGDLKGWWALNYTLTFDERGGSTVTGELEPDLRKLDGWGRMTAAQHERALAAAKRYVVHAQPEPERWFGTGTIWKPAFAGYRALYLIAVAEPAWLDALPPEAWTRWASIIVGYPLSNYSEDPTHGNLLRRAMAAAPEEIARWFLRKVDADNERSGTVIGLWRLRDRPASAVVDALAGKVEDPSLTPAARQALVEFVLTHDSARGLELATRMLEHFAPGLAASAEDDTVARITAVLLDLAPAKAWPRLVPVLRSQAGRAVFKRVVDEHRSVGADLADEPLGDLVRILFALFAPQDDPPLRSGAYVVSPSEQLGQLRDGLLAVLAQRGSDVAVATIAELQAAHSDVHNLRFRLRDARDARRARWPAPSPGDIIRLAHTTDARIVMSAEHLHQLLVASLRRAEAALQGTPPRARELWNQQPLTPKDEGALSDWLHGWFDQDLLVGGRFVGRELQVRPSVSGRGRGEDVDLTVSATVGEHVQDAETVAVRIEVKGCWHPDLETAMEEQLAVRYLHPVSQPHGIYVIGALDAAAWADGDRRRGPCRRRRVLDVRERFDRQATEVSAARGVKVAAVVLDVTFPPWDAMEETPAPGAA